MNIEDIIKESYCYKQCIEKLKWNITGTNYTKLKKIIKDRSIDISHFSIKSNFNTRLNKIPIENILIENSNYGRGHVKRRILSEKLLKYECVFCGNDGNWMGKKFSLILDHINGVNNDHRLFNLRLVCPNCNATLDTFCGKNVKNTQYSHEYKENKCSCGNTISTDAEHCVKCSKIKMRKVARPPLNILLNEVNEYGYSSTGRKYGVSDNSIRKWIKIGGEEGN
jgi:hypothetical protein